MTDTVHRMKNEAADLAIRSNDLLAKAANALLEATELNKHQQARLAAVDDYAAREFDLGWPTELRELAEKLRQIPPAVTGTDGAHVDLCIEVATFLDIAFGDGVGAGDDALAEVVGADSETPHELVSSALTKAESNRDRRVTIGTEPTEGD